MPDADRRLVHELNQGTADSLGVLYDAHAEPLFDYCLSMVAEPKAAAGIVHDTFIDAHRRAPRMRDRDRLRAWLYGAARRRCLQRGRSRGLSWDWAAGSAWLREVQGTDAGVTPGEVRELVEAALGRLDFTDQEILLLSLRHGLGAADVAIVLGRPPRRAAALVAQARDRAETAITAELRTMSRRCETGRAPVRALHPAEAPVELAGRTAEFADRTRESAPAAAEHRAPAVRADGRFAEGRASATGAAGGAVEGEGSVAGGDGGVAEGRVPGLGAAGGAAEREGPAAGADGSPGERVSLPSDVRVAPVPGGRRVPGRRPAAGAEREGGAAAAVGRAAEGPAAGVRRTKGGSRAGLGGRRPVAAGGRAGAPVRGRRRAPGGDGAASAGHLDCCAECGRRDRVTVGALLELAPAPVLPAALRHRVMHTATDPELAGHRADIAARGGTLTPEGLPRQPDMPSKYTRRWLFAGGGAAGALVTGLVAILLMGPVNSGIRFPFDPRPQPSIGDVRQEASDGRHGGGTGGERGPIAAPPGLPGPGPGPGATPGPPGPHFDDVPPRESPTPGGPSPAPTPPSPQRPTPPAPQIGRLSVGPGTVTLDRDGATITLTAAQGPVVWTAVSTSDKLTLSASDGTLPEGASAELHVVLKDRSLINLPGEATITVTDRQGVQHPVQVKWHLSLL